LGEGAREKMMMKEEEEDWETFCEQKFSQTLSKNFALDTRRERRVSKTLIEKQPRIMILPYF